MKRIQRVDLIDGPILPALLSFAFPILLSNIFQQLYNTSDVMIVGRFLGQNHWLPLEQPLLFLI